MKTINIGLIGYGYMGKTHSMAYINLPLYYDLKDVKINLYGVWSKSLKKDNHYGYKIYEDYRALINDPEIDVVDICLPNFMHSEVLIEAIKANKHIYCEKPLTVDLQEALTIQELVKKTEYSSINRIVFEYRYTPAVMKAKELIINGELGEIINFNMKYYGSEFLNPDRAMSWQSIKEKSGGGVLCALGSHAIDLIQYLFGDIKGVYARMKTLYTERSSSDGSNGKKTVETEDIVNANLTIENDIMGNLMLSQVAAGSTIDLQFEIYGTQGSVKFNHENPNILEYYSYCKDKNISSLEENDGFISIQTTQKYGPEAVYPPPRVNISWLRYHIASQYDFIKAVVEDKQTKPDLMDGYKVQKIIDGIITSSLSNKFTVIE